MIRSLPLAVLNIALRSPVFQFVSSGESAAFVTETIARSTRTLSGGPPMKKLTSLICSFLILIAMTATVALAQGTTSRVTGVVQDKNGASVAGATVTLANEGTGVSLTAQTSDSGTYTFDLIQVGTYSVTVEKQGFKKFVSSHNLANVNEPLTVSATLEVGTVSEVVQVTTTAEAVQTSTSGNVGSTVEQKIGRAHV